MPIGNVDSNEKGSGARYNDDKPDLSLIPLSTLEDEARVWMYGKEKYAAFNWVKGMDWSIPLACALRHIAAFQSGEILDKESGLPHIAHAMCNLRMLTLYSKIYPEGDDRESNGFLKEYYDKSRNKIKEPEDIELLKEKWENSFMKKIVKEFEDE